MKIRSGKDDGNAGKGALIGIEQSFTLGCNNDQTLFQEVSTVGGQSEPIYSIGHDERSAGLKPNVVDPLTRKDYLRSPVVAQPINNKG